MKIARLTISFPVSLRRAQCALPFARLAPWQRSQTLRSCGPPTLDLAFHTSGAECRSENAFAMRIRRPGLSFLSAPFFSLSSRLTRTAQRRQGGVFDKEKALTFDRGLFDQRLQMRFPRGRHCNDYARVSRTFHEFRYAYSAV